MNRHSRYEIINTEISTAGRIVKNLLVLPGTKSSGTKAKILVKTSMVTGMNFSQEPAIEANDISVKRAEVLW